MLVLSTVFLTLHPSLGELINPHSLITSYMLLTPVWPQPTTPLQMLCFHLMAPLSRFPTIPLNSTFLNLSSLSAPMTCNPSRRYLRLLPLSHSFLAITKFSWFPPNPQCPYSGSKEITNGSSLSHFLKLKSVLSLEWSVLNKTLTLSYPLGTCKPLPFHKALSSHHVLLHIFHHRKLNCV